MPHDQYLVQGVFFFFFTPLTKKATLGFPALIVDMLVGDRPQKDSSQQRRECGKAGGDGGAAAGVWPVLSARKPAGETGAG